MQCKVRECHNDVAPSRKGLCQTHYSRMKTRGTYVALKDIPFEKRFWSKVKRSSRDGCWLWTAATVNGYGYIDYPKGTRHTTHRLAWTFTYGPIPDKHVVKHQSTCVSDACCRPDHLYLELMNQRLHLLCKNGRHMMTPENTLPAGPRRCRACYEVYRERRRIRDQRKRLVKRYQDSRKPLVA